jgi:hypothetical protein
MRRRVILALCSVFLAAGSAAGRDESAPDRPVNEGGRVPHPEPRVIVNVLTVKGPHLRSEVERAARLGWGRIIRCYKLEATNEKGLVSLELVIAGSGQVQTARRVRSTLQSTTLSSCLTKAMQGLGMPKASGRSTATAEIHVAPGDPPGGDSA